LQFANPNFPEFYFVFKKALGYFSPDILLRKSIGANGWQLAKDRVFYHQTLFEKLHFKYTIFSVRLATRPCFWLGAVSRRLFVFPSKIGRYRAFQAD